MKTKEKTKYLKVFLSLALLIFLVVLFVFSKNVLADEVCRSGVMIYEIYGGGGNSGASYKNDYMLLFNSAAEDVVLDGWSMQYASASGLFSDSETKLTKLTGSIKAGGYFLIGEAGGSNEADILPAVDAQGLINFAATEGKIALSAGNSKISGVSDVQVVDFVGYGGANEFEGNFPAPKPSSSNKESIFRKNESCLDSGSNDIDFFKHVPQPLSSVEADLEEDKEEEIVVPACKDNIVLSEIFPFEGEFVEIENIGAEKCDLAGWKISDQANGKHAIEANSVVEDGGYFAFMKDVGLNISSADGAKLFDPNDLLVEEKEYLKPKDKDVSFAKNELGEWAWTTKTPNEKNVFEEKVEIRKEYSTGISITELFPNPSKSKYEEYIELYNGTSEDVDLLGWMLRDASKTGKFVFLESVILKAKKYLAVFKKDFKFALNNSGKESVTLFDPNGKEISTISYEGSKKNVSYNFGKNSWHWSKFLTSGKENILNNEPFGKLKMPEDIFVNTFAAFSISTGDKDGDKVKVVWDFGDGRKSYLTKTRHKYLKTGKYSGSAKLSDGSEDILKKFIVEVKKFPHPNVNIIAVKANPAGIDSEKESLTIENKSKSKINLNGWSIATGLKSLINHPISEDLFIDRNKKLEITKKFSNFTLNNKSAKIELRYPDGEIASKVKYDHGKTSIADDEIYQKVKSGWVWLGAKQNTITKKQETNKIQYAIINIQNDAGTESVVENEEMDVGEIAALIIIERENKLLLNNNEFVKIELLRDFPSPFDVREVREINGKYFFMPQNSQREHFIIVFFKNIFLSMNEKLNMLLNILRI